MVIKKRVAYRIFWRIAHEWKEMFFLTLIPRVHLRIGKRRRIVEETADE